MEKGKILVGISSALLNIRSESADLMSLGFSSSKYKSSTGETSDPYRAVAFNLMPKAGYFVRDNLAVGLNIIVNIYSEIDKSDDDKYADNLLGIGPWARYYYPLEKCYPFAEVNLGVASEKEKWEYGSSSDDEKHGLFMFGGGIGAAMPLSDRVTFDFMAGYNSVILKEKDQGSEVSYKEIHGTLGIILGFVVYFGPK
jgi:hypothetical protein